VEVHGLRPKRVREKHKRLSAEKHVRLERVRAFEVVSRLQTKFRAFVKLEPILWEHDAQSGWATFQGNIVPPSKTDIVICILWARIARAKFEESLQVAFLDSSHYASWASMAW